jgi:carbonic anhydrase
MRGHRQSLSVIVTLALRATLALAAIGCDPPAREPPPTPRSAPAAAHWSYEGEGAAAWPGVCRSGREQSPLDLALPAGGAMDAAPTLAFGYVPVSLKSSHNGHTVLLDTAGQGAGLTVDGQRYELAQVHVHAPSEHTLRGEHADLELHFVHKEASGTLAVVALLARRGAKNQPLATFFEHLPSGPESGSIDVAGQTVDLGGAIGGRRTYFAYTGSLTTPPCTEHVRWFVLDDAAEVSAEQLAAVRAALRGDTARPVQPRNERRLAHTP